LAYVGHIGQDVLAHGLLAGGEEFSVTPVGAARIYKMAGVLARALVPIAAHFFKLLVQANRAWRNLFGHSSQGGLAPCASRQDTKRDHNLWHLGSADFNVAIGAAALLEVGPTRLMFGKKTRGATLPVVLPGGRTYRGKERKKPAAAT